MPAENLSTGWHGNLNLIYAKRAGTTQLIHNRNQAPLKVQRPFYPEGPAVCHSVILHTAGGIVGRLSRVADAYVTVEVAQAGANSIEITVQKQAVQTLLPKGTIKAI